MEKETTKNTEEDRQKLMAILAGEDIARRKYCGSMSDKEAIKKVEPPVLIDILLQAERLVSERAGMIAENKQRDYLGQSMAYWEDSFQKNAQGFEGLRELLRKQQGNKKD